MGYATPDNVTDIASWLQYSNDVTNSWFGIIVSIVIFVVFFMVFSRAGGVKAFALSSFVTSISIILLRIMGIVSDMVVIFGVVFMIFGVVALIFSEKG